jgi:uncharacterized protein involved in exopolysaccharide biosynthesis
MPCRLRHLWRRWRWYFRGCGDGVTGVLMTGNLDERSSTTNPGASTEQPYGPPVSQRVVEPTEVSTFRLMNLVLRNLRLFILLPLALATFAAISTIVGGVTFTARASFVPQISESSQSSRLSSLASQFGVDLGSEAALMSSPGFYRTLILSDEILGATAAKSYEMPAGSGQLRPLSEILDVRERTPEETAFRTLRDVRNMTAVEFDRETGVVQIAVQSEWRDLSLQMVEAILGLVNDFNVRKRRDQAAAEQDFMQGRLEAARGRLRASEDALQSFLQRNRQFQGDPQLMFAYDRLRREVEMHNSVFTVVAQAHEQAGLNAVRDTPVITVIQRPVAPPRRDPRGLVINTLVALMGGLAIALAYAMVADYHRSSRDRHARDYAEFKELAAGLRRRSR